MENNRRILIVEKDADRLSLLESRLVAREFCVTTETASAEALKALEKQNFDLILISSKMELVGGEELCQKIRKGSLNCFVPVIMVIDEEDLAGLIHGIQQGFDDFLIIPFDPLTLQLRVLLNIHRAEERMQANPLTRLPGNIAIERALKDRISSGEFFSVCYLDINHFKSFNDVYGFDRGDDVIRQTSRIISLAARKADSRQPFIGHVGGDDFIVILHPDTEETFAKECIREFDRIIPTCYSEEDQKRGHVTVRNRKGKTERFPIMGISIAAVNNLYRKLTNPAEIAQVAAEVKKFLKTQAGSNYLRDRRARQFDNFDEALAVFSPPADNAEPQKSVEPLGQFLLNAGLLNEQQLSDALKRHLATGERLGQVLIAMNLVHSHDVGRMLEKKLGVPYISLVGRSLSRELVRLFTAEFVKSHRVIPVAVADGNLQLAMLDPFDLKVIDDIERITGFRVMPGLALEEEFERFFEKHYRKVEAF